jgi:predicted nucleic acid-binding Zn ribbon protein
MSFQKLVDILKRIRNENPALSLRLAEAAWVSRWNDAVGPGIAKHTRVIRVEEGVLWIEVDHPLWKAELHHRKRQILEKLEQLALQKENEARLASITDIRYFDPRRTGLTHPSAAPSEKLQKPRQPK